MTEGMTAGIKTARTAGVTQDAGRWWHPFLAGKGGGGGKFFVL